MIAAHVTILNIRLARTYFLYGVITTCWSPPKGPRPARACSSYYALTFLLPRYYEEIFGDNEKSVYILTMIVGASLIPGMSFWRAGVSDAIR